VKLFDLATVSVHLGEDYGTIELDGKALTDEQLRQTEQYARRLVGENLPVEILSVEDKDLDSIPFRRKPKRAGTLRVIKIGELEWSACGGTHCSSTAEVGLIKLVGTGKIRGHVLAKFLAGAQVADDYDMRFAATDGLSQGLTCHVSDLPEKFGKLQSDNKELARTLTQLRKEMLPMHAGTLAASKKQVGSEWLVFEKLDDFDSKLAATLGTMVADKIDGVSVLFLQGRLIVSTSEKSAKDARKIVSTLTEKAGLKGGGSPRQAQVGGAEVNNLSHYREIVMSVLSDE
jgi:alanyl-tRNA synthetase